MTVAYHSNLVKLMLPSELSINIVLMVVIPIILIFYAILLVKLRPSKETESPSNRSIERKREPLIEPKRLEKPTTYAEPRKITNERPASPVKTQISFKPQESPKEPGIKVEHKEDVPIQAHAETVVTEKNEKLNKDKASKKSFFLFGETNFEGCSYKFGYLSSLSKNTPIPNECFGCSQIVECLKT